MRTTDETRDARAAQQSALLRITTEERNAECKARFAAEAEAKRLRRAVALWFKGHDHDCPKCKAIRAALNKQEVNPGVDMSEVHAIREALSAVLGSYSEAAGDRDGTTCLYVSEGALAAAHTVLARAAPHGGDRPPDPPLCAACGKPPRGMVDSFRACVCGAYSRGDR